MFPLRAAPQGAVLRLGQSWKEGDIDALDKKSCGASYRRYPHETGKQARGKGGKKGDRRGAPKVPPRKGKRMRANELRQKSSPWCVFDTSRRGLDIAQVPALS